MTAWDRFAFSFLNFPVMARYFPQIVSGFLVTVELAITIVITGLIAGLALAAIRSLAIRPLNWLIIFVVDVFPRLPPLVIIVLIYFGLPAAGLTPSGFVSTWASLSLVLMAFAEEIYWAGIVAIPRGQWDAARSTGPVLRADPDEDRASPGAAHHHSAADQPHDRDHQGHGARFRRRRRRHPLAVEFRCLLQLQPLPPDFRCRRLLVLFLPIVLLGRWIETRFAWKR